MQVGDKWHRVEIVNEEVRDHYEEWEGGGGGERTKEAVWVLRCDCSKEFKVAKDGFRKKLCRDCGCGMADKDGRKVLVGPYTVPQSTLEMIQQYAKEHTQGNASHAITLMVRKMLMVRKITMVDTVVDVDS